MSVQRSPNGRADGTFVVVDKAVIHDPDLSFRARGLLVWALDHPADWDFSADRIVKATTEGRDAVLAAMGELDQAGLLRRVKWRNSNGTVSTHVQVRESTDLEWPANPQVTPTTGNQGTVNQGTVSQGVKEGRSLSTVNEDPSFHRRSANGQHFAPTWGDLCAEAFMYFEDKTLHYKRKVGVGRAYDRVTDVLGIEEAQRVFREACWRADEGRPVFSELREAAKDALGLYGHDGEEEFADILNNDMSDETIPMTDPNMTLAFLNQATLGDVDASF